MSILPPMLTSLEVVNHLPLHPVAFGAVALAIALVFLAFVLIMGTLRPHS